MFYWPLGLHCLDQATTNKIYPFKALETTIKKQDDEIERLKNTQKVIKISKVKNQYRDFFRRHY